jgi:hypothetical protein
MLICCEHSAVSSSEGVSEAQWQFKELMTSISHNRCYRTVFLIRKVVTESCICIDRRVRFRHISRTLWLRVFNLVLLSAASPEGASVYFDSLSTSWRHRNGKHKSANRGALAGEGGPKKEAVSCVLCEGEDCLLI